MKKNNRCKMNLKQNNKQINKLKEEINFLENDCNYNKDDEYKSYNYTLTGELSERRTF